MFNADVLTFHEFMMDEALPLATIQGAVLEFLHDRPDVVLYGAQAVNAYVTDPRMTQDVVLLSSRAAAIAQELRTYLADRFHIALRVCEIKAGRGYRLYQVRKPSNRHLVDIRQAKEMPQVQQIRGVPVIAPPDLIASKVIAYHQRRGKPKSGTDWRDIAMLLLAFPHLKSDTGPVSERLQSAGTDPTVLKLWEELVAQDIEPENDEDEFL